MEIERENQRDDQQIIEYFLENYRKDIRLLMRRIDPSIYYNFSVNMIEFFDRFPESSNKFFQKPLEMKSLLEESIVASQKQYAIDYATTDKYDEDDELFDAVQEISDGLGQELSVKEFVFVQFVNIPYTKDVYKTNLTDIGSNDINKLVIVSGTVIRTSTRKVLQKSKQFKCSNCEQEYVFKAEHENYGVFQTNSIKCNKMITVEKKNNPFYNLMLDIKRNINQNNNNNYRNRQQNNLEEEEINNDGGNNNSNSRSNPVQNKTEQRKCGSQKFEAVDGTEICIDYQEIRIQEPFKTLKPGNIPKTMWVILESNLVDQMKAGDDAIVTGILIKRWKKATKDSRPEVSLCIIANSIQIKNYQKNLNEKDKNQLKSTLEEELDNFYKKQRDLTTEIAARNQLIQSSCPDIFEKNDIKLAVLLCLIGGVSRIENNTRIRGQCHMMLVGEPGTGKSQILKYATKLSNRSVFTTGIGSTSAGLTVSFTKEQGGEWIMEAGALVLADMGVCCIDEFNLIKKGDHDSVLEAMEQQTISASKAGITSKLNSRTTILAACNPILPGQRYQTSVDITENTGLQSPLLSRFDLIFIVKDIVNYDADSEACEFILERFMKKEDRMMNYHRSESLWEIEKLREYINLVQNKFEPTITPDASQLIQKYYQHLRSIELLHSKTTIRALESLVRLCQAHSRLMYRDKVEVFDAICVIILQECSYFTGLLENLDPLEYILLDEDKYEEIEHIIKNNLRFISQSQS
ncbi:hypothetical protein ABPG72_017349 [Tetrahymena utriculariae]